MVMYNGLTELLDLFRNNGWTSNGVVGSEEGITCYKEGHETEYFQIKYSDFSGADEPIYVTVPLKNSRYQYVLYFKEFGSATSYITKMFYEYTNTNVPIS